MIWQQIFTAAFFTAFLSSAVRMAVPLFYSALGETVSERAGILNMGLEGIMVCGAYFSFLAAYLTGSLLLGTLAGMLGGMVVSLVHAFISITMRQNQTVTGIALNILCLGLTSYLFKLLVGSNVDFPQIATLPNIAIPLLSRIPVIGEAFFNKDILVYMAYALIAVVSVFLYKTTWGMTLVSVGENPRAADTVGINVFRTRYLAAMVNGLLGGLGGAYLMVGQLGLYSEGVTAGRGYIAMAIVVFGKRSPLGVFLAALFFGAADAVQFRMQTLGVNLPAQLFTGLPYLLTVIALISVAKKNTSPSALTQPYVRSAR